MPTPRIDAAGVFSAGAGRRAGFDGSDQADCRDIVIDESPAGAG